MEKVSLFDGAGDILLKDLWEECLMEYATDTDRPESDIEEIVNGLETQPPLSGEERERLAYLLRMTWEAFQLGCEVTARTIE